MIIVYSGQTNVLRLTLAAKATGNPITAGTVNFYLKAQTGDDAAKWYKGATATWEASESIAGAATHSSDGHWELSLASAVWTSNVHYAVYAKESGDLHIPVDQDVLCAAYGGSIVSGSGPLTTAAMKLHLRVDHDDDDDLIDQLILAATAWCEEFQGRTYVNRSRTMVLDRFESVIRPPYPPLVSVDSIQYVDTAGSTQTLDASYYRVDTTNEPGRITEAYSMSWPSIRAVTNAVTITYTAGYGAAADVPDQVKAAIKLLVGHWYEHREAAAEINLNTAPLAVEDLLWNDRIYNF
jgi:uncharacterized phiE125 gp8 family phage protein